jgi:hypothetical protein
MEFNSMNVAAWLANVKLGHTGILQFLAFYGNSRRKRSRQFSPTVLPNFPRRPTIHPPFHRGSPGSPTNFAPSETVPRHVKLPITSRDITVLQGDLTRCALDAQARLGYHIGILMGHRYHATCVYVYNICMYVMSCHVMYMYIYIYIYILCV